MLHAPLLQLEIAVLEFVSRSEDQQYYRRSLLYIVDSMTMVRYKVRSNSQDMKVKADATCFFVSRVYPTGSADGQG